MHLDLAAPLACSDMITEDVIKNSATADFSLSLEQFAGYSRVAAKRTWCVMPRGTVVPMANNGKVSAIRLMPLPRPLLVMAEP